MPRDIIPNVDLGKRSLDSRVVRIVRVSETPQGKSDAMRVVIRL